jgi:hypothetical protein
MMSKECTNCEGEGFVCRWGLYGHEVPASRKIYYPSDRPYDEDIDTQDYKCEVCNGRGWRRDGANWRGE